MTAKLSERQRELLTKIQHMGFEPGEWFRPMDVGGRDGSDHSAVLAQLSKKGLLDMRWRTGPGGKWARGSKKYRLTSAGSSESTSPRCTNTPGS